jgi:hypothetical protein
MKKFKHWRFITGVWTMPRTVQPEAAQANDHLPAHAEKTDALSKFTAEAHESYNNIKFEPASANPNPGNNTEVAAMLQNFVVEGMAPQYQTDAAPILNPSAEYNRAPNPGEQAPNSQSELPFPALQALEAHQLPGQEPSSQYPALQYPEFQTQLPGQEASNPALQTPELPGQIPGQPELPSLFPGQPADAQSQMPGAVNPISQELLGLFTQNGDATAAQQAALGIEQSVGTGLMSALTGGASDGNSPFGSDNSDDSGSDDSGSDESGSDDSGSDNSGSDDSSADNSDDSQQDAYSFPAWMQQYALAGG